MLIIVHTHTHTYTHSDVAVVNLKHPPPGNLQKCSEVEITLQVILLHSPHLHPQHKVKGQNRSIKCVQMIKVNLKRKSPPLGRRYTLCEMYNNMSTSDDQMTKFIMLRAPY